MYNFHQTFIQCVESDWSVPAAVASDDTIVAIMVYVHDMTQVELLF